MLYTLAQRQASARTRGRKPKPEWLAIHQYMETVAGYTQLLPSTQVDPSGAPLRRMLTA